MIPFIWIILLAIAAVFNAVMDSVENEHFYQTVFRDKKPGFWYKRDSWNKAKKVFGWKFDAWHCSKSLMLVFIAISIISYREIFNPYYDFGIAGSIGTPGEIIGANFNDGTGTYVGFRALNSSASASGSYAGLIMSAENGAITGSMLLYPSATANNGLVIETSTLSSIIFSTNSTERARITYDGLFRIGTPGVADHPLNVFFTDGTATYYGTHIKNFSTSTTNSYAGTVVHAQNGTVGFEVLAYPAGTSTPGYVAETLTPHDMYFKPNTVTALQLKTNGQLVIPDYGSGANTGTAAKWLAVTSAGLVIEENPPSGGGGFSNPMTTQGDLIYGGSSGTATRLAASTAGYLLQTNGSGADPTWVAPPGASGTSLVVIDDANYTVAAGITDIVFKHLTAGRTLTLPSASSNANRPIYISNGGAGAFNITTSVSLRENANVTTTTIGQGTRVKLVSDGTEWWIIHF